MVGYRKERDMSYTKTPWSNGATALSADNMNHIENGIKDAHDAIDVLETQYGNLVNFIYPVESILFTTNSENPGVRFPGTTWVAWGSGRVPVGVDIEQEEFDTVEKAGGDKTVTLSVNQIPNHSHDYTAVQGVTGNTRSYSTDGSTSKTAVYSLNVGKSKASTEGAGKGYAHDNLQPYVTCYMWKRTA